MRSAAVLLALPLCYWRCRCAARMQRVGKEGGGVLGATFGVAPASEAIVTSTKQVDIWNVSSLLSACAAASHRRCC